MTLILSTLYPDGAVQVTDRLVSLERRSRPSEEFDALSNKNIVFLARDGLVTIGYTGLAYLDGVPTDRWLARKLAMDESLQDDGRGSMRQGFGVPKRWFTVGEAILTLAWALTDLYASMRTVSGLPSLELAIVGWQWKASRWQWNLARSRPVAWHINKDGAAKRFLASQLPRYWGWEKRPGEFKFVDTPPRLSRETKRALLEELAKVGSLALAAEVLRRTIREVAEYDAGVGRDCMSIRLPHPAKSRIVDIAFSSPEPRERTDRLPGYTPWVVAPDTVVSPTAVNAGSIEVFAGPFTFRFEGGQQPLVRDDGIIVVFEPQPRRAAPRQGGSPETPLPSMLPHGPPLPSN
jgi:hypothetical protein